ncbi:zinc finger protein 37-like [Prorops nasuta]|uniref:zinc finger protein 37-like n=1 Tax=Prorops nasuta TaxID=863751 RepID=UPI0034D012EC
MSEECPNCRQPANSSFTRLVKDSCGHTKCRMCLLYEEQGCKACENNQQCIQPVVNLNTSSVIGTSDNTCAESKGSISNEENTLPLELVINKDVRGAENYFNMVSATKTLDSERKEDNKSISVSSLTKSIAPNNLYTLETENPMLNTTDCINVNNSEDTNLPVQDTCFLSTKEEVQLDVNSSKTVSTKDLKNPDRSHILVLPGAPETYKCSICNKVFRNKKGKCYHDACLTGIKPYQCSICDRSFVKRSHFEYHERVHSGQKPFKCNKCDKAFYQQNKLNRHMYSHNKEKQFACPDCGKKYRKKDDLKNHMNIHNNGITHNCKSCDKTFYVLTNLKRHMRTHTSERPHKCDQCHKSFKDSTLLLRHKKTHGKERPFSCAHCNRVFLSKSELRRHLAIHTDEKPFSCEFCQTVFRRKDNLNRHIRHHHSENSNVEIKKSVARVSVSQKKPAKPKANRQKQKPNIKKGLYSISSSTPKSTAKVSVVYINSQEQINSRLDSMGNITPVIRTTSELSNAVPVINGPISAKKPEEKTDSKRKKTFSYTEPIPLEEAVVINRKIEEKLYPQAVSNHSYFFRNSSIHTERVNYPVLQTRYNYSIANNILNKTLSYESSTPELAPQTEVARPSQITEGEILTTDKTEKAIQDVQTNRLRNMKCKAQQTDRNTVPYNNAGKNTSTEGTNQCNLHWRRKMAKNVQSHSK